MGFSRTQVAIAVAAGALLILIFFGYLLWLNNQGPVLSRSEGRGSTYTMVFSNQLSPERTGWALAVPCRQPVTVADQLIREAEALWAAEQSGRPATALLADRASPEEPVSAARARPEGASRVPQPRR